MNKFITLKPIFQETNNHLKGFLENSLNNFFNELNTFCETNCSHDFVEYFTERTYLSMFINGIIRADNKNEVSSAQEYGVKYNKAKGHGRCDAFININKDILIVESKMQRFKNQVDDGHWDIEEWMKYDDSIREQAIMYFREEDTFFVKEDRYNSCHIMTLVFKAVKELPEAHLEKAKRNLLSTYQNTGNKSWFYSAAFLNSHDNKDGFSFGLEAYGTIEEVYNKTLSSVQSK